MTLAHTMHPRDFEVNQTWLAFRVNQRPLLAEGQEFDIFVLQDAASMFIFGNAFAAVARQLGISVRSTPEAQMSFYIKDVQESLEEHFGRGADGEG